MKHKHQLSMKVIGLYMKERSKQLYGTCKPAPENSFFKSAIRFRDIMARLHRIGVTMLFIPLMMMVVKIQLYINPKVTFAFFRISKLNSCGSGL